MKTIDQYTDDELLNLEPETKQALIELQCALDGVPLLPPYPQCPKNPVVECDAVSYNVNMGYSSVASFKTKDAAQLVVDAINGGDQVYLDYDHFGGQRVDCIKDRDVSVASVEVKKCASLNLMASMKDELDKYKKDKGIYDELMEVYNTASEARTDSIAIVENAINDAYTQDYNRKDALRKYEHYLGLSDGDAKIAMQFFCANYSDLREFLPEELQASEEAG